MREREWTILKTLAHTYPQLVIAPHSLGFLFVGLWLVLGLTKIELKGKYNG